MGGERLLIVGESARESRGDRPPPVRRGRLYFIRSRCASRRTAFAVAQDIQPQAGHAEGPQQTKGVHVPKQDNLPIHQ